MVPEVICSANYDMTIISSCIQGVVTETMAQATQEETRMNGIELDE